MHVLMQGQYSQILMVDTAFTLKFTDRIKVTTDRAGKKPAIVHP